MFYIIAFNFMYLLIDSIIDIMVPSCLVEYKLCKEFRVIPIEIINIYSLWPDTLTSTFPDRYIKVNRAIYTKMFTAGNVISLFYIVKLGKICCRLLSYVIRKCLWFFKLLCGIINNSLWSDTDKKNVHWSITDNSNKLWTT